MPKAHGKFPGQGLNPCPSSDPSCHSDKILNPLSHQGTHRDLKKKKKWELRRDSQHFFLFLSPFLLSFLFHPLPSYMVLRNNKMRKNIDNFGILLGNIFSH